MELLTSPFLNRPQFLSRVSFSSSRTANKKNSFEFNIPHFKSPLCFPFFSNSPFSNAKKLEISAHFRRPSNRRNSLRKKLVGDQQVRHNPISNNPHSDFQNPSSSLNDTESFRENLNYDSVKENHTAEESKSKVLGESVLLNELENWVDQYRKDAEYWGIGSGPIFTIIEDSDGNVERVVVGENEILRRSGHGELEDLSQVNLKISYAKSLAREMESGKNVIPRNSSIAKFVVSGEKSGIVNVIRNVTLPPELSKKLSRVGFSVLCGFVVVWAVKKLFTTGNRKVEFTSLEKEMMRRKIKSRMGKEEVEEVSVEVVQPSPELPMVSTERPKLDQQELMSSILRMKDDLASKDFDGKIQEIREMARRAREIEGQDPSLVDGDGEENQIVIEELSDEAEVIKQHTEEDASFLNNLSKGAPMQAMGINGTVKPSSLGDKERDDLGLSSEPSPKNKDLQTLTALSGPYDRQSTTQDLEDSENTSDSLDAIEAIQSTDSHYGQTSMPKKGSTSKIPRVIMSVKEARDYLSKKQDKQELQVRVAQESHDDLRLLNGKASVNNSRYGLDMNDNVFEHSIVCGTSDFTPAANASDEGNTDLELSIDKALMSDTSHGLDNDDNDPEDAEEEVGVLNLQASRGSMDHEGDDSFPETGPSVIKENWMEKNFHQLEPVVKKIGTGFRENYMVAREKVNQELNMSLEVPELESGEDHSELEWMKDDNLREIVFQVRENELAGLDPFYSMDDEDKAAFFKGLERKVEKENEKLLNLHGWIHSNVENIDYGTDGISLYDPPDKIIPRWKGPPIEKDPEFLNNFVEQRKVFFAENAGSHYPMKNDEQVSLQESKESLPHESPSTSSAVFDPKKKFHDGASKRSKTIIESSDGSIKASKKSGKEYWQHTKKWSHGFLESYNAETDPEVKSAMKDIGKDLDRWITDKEIQESADLITKMRERNKKFMEKRLEKLKREMELFGPQAVVSKYREYGDEKEEDYLWWLDVPFVLCIELYTTENEEHKVGFYSLEMAADLELEPKQYHVIAFEDPGDCKNLCYIIQAHMDMLGNGHAFVVARPPKDAFREAKGNGFSVTVIRKGQLQLNVDQTLEEVEEQIIEIGSKIYHDKITQERSVDISALMKGVFGPINPTKPSKRRRLKRRRKKPTK